MASKFTRVRTITQSVLKLKPGQPRFFFLLSAMYTGKKIDVTREAATLVHAVDMETGEEGLVIVTAIMKKELQENYPGDSYVRKGFEVCITRAADPAAGVKYNHISLSEVGVPDDFTPPTLGTEDGAGTAAAPAAEPAPAKSGKPAK